jgi:quercetin dioxygenase-like cupin family protein
MSGKFTLHADVEPDVLDWGRLRMLSHPPSTGAKQITVIDADIYPGKGHDFHFHRDQEEVLYVLSGTVEQWLEREKRMLGPGDSIFIPAGTVHASFSAGPGEARVLAILSPSVGEAGIEMVDVSGEAPWNGLRTDAV